MEFSPGQGNFRRRITLKSKGHPESFAELALPLEEGEVVTYEWTAEGEVDFNIHSHHGKEVDYHEKFRGSELHGRFEGPRKDHFYLMWQNRSPESVEIEIQVSR